MTNTNINNNATVNANEEVKKLHKKDYFAMLENMVKKSKHSHKDELLAFIANELDLLAKKSGKTGGSKEKQAENMELQMVLLDTMVEMGKPATISDMQAFNTDLTKYSTPKLSAMMKRLLEDKTVVRVVEKKKAYFSIAA